LLHFGKFFNDLKFKMATIMIESLCFVDISHGSPTKAELPFPWWRIWEAYNTAFKTPIMFLYYYDLFQQTRQEQQRVVGVTEQVGVLRSMYQRATLTVFQWTQWVAYPVSVKEAQVNSFNVRGCRVMILNATFNNISVIPWRSVLLVEEARVHRENHPLAVSH
jgi:hypothetical protein